MCAFSRLRFFEFAELPSPLVGAERRGREEEREEGRRGEKRDKREKENEECVVMERECASS